MKNTDLERLKFTWVSKSVYEREIGGYKIRVMRKNILVFYMGMPMAKPIALCEKNLSLALDAVKTLNRLNNPKAARI